MGVVYYKDQKPTKEQLAEIKTKEDLSKLLGFSVDFFGEYGLDKENGWEIDSENKWLKFKANQAIIQTKIPTQVKFQGKNSGGNAFSCFWSNGNRLPIMEYIPDGIEDTGQKTITPSDGYTVRAVASYHALEKAYYINFTFSGSFHKQFAVGFKPISLNISTTYEVKSYGQITPKTRAIGNDIINISVDNFVEDGEFFTWSYTKDVLLTLSLNNDTLYNVTINNSSGTLDYKYQGQNAMMLPMTEVNLGMDDHLSYWWDNKQWTLLQTSKFDISSTVSRTIINDYNGNPAIQHWTPSNFRIANKYPLIYSFKGNKDIKTPENSGQFVNTDNEISVDGPEWDGSLYGENSYFGAKDGNWVIPLFTNENIKDSNATETEINIKKNEVLINNKSYFFPKKSKLILFRRYTTQTPIVDKKFGIYWQTDYASTSDPVWFWAIHFYGRNNYDPNNIMAPKKYSPGFFCGAVDGPGILGTGYDRSCAVASLSSANGGGSYSSKYTPDAAPAESIVSIKIDSYNLDYTLIELDVNTTTISLSNNTNMSTLEWKNVNGSNFSSLKSMENQVVKSYPPERDVPAKADYTVAQYINKYVTRSEMTSWTGGGSSASQFSNWTLNSGNYFEFKFNNVPYMSCFHNRNFTRECNVQDEAEAMEADNSDTTYQYAYVALRWNITDVVGGLFPGSVNICTIDQNVSNGKKTIYYKQNGKDLHGELPIDYTNHKDSAGVYLYNHLLYNKNTKYTYWVAVVGPDWKGN